MKRGGIEAPAASAWTRPDVLRALDHLRRCGPPDGFTATSGGVPKGDGAPVGQAYRRTSATWCGAAVEFADLCHAIDCLGDRVRDAVWLYYVLGLTQQEIADKLGRYQQRVSELLRRGREVIIAILVNDEP